jgi:hypothetical protein
MGYTHLVSGAGVTSVYLPADPVKQIRQQIRKSWPQNPALTRKASLLKSCPRFKSLNLKWATTALVRRPAVIASVAGALPPDDCHRYQTANEKVQK